MAERKNSARPSHTHGNGQDVHEQQHLVQRHRSLPRLGSQLVQLAGIPVQAVHHLPQRRRGLQRVPLRERRQVAAVVPQRRDKALVAVHEHPLSLVQVRRHGCLRSPSVPITIRSSFSRLAFSSNRGRLPSSAFFTPNRRPSWASASSLLSPAMMASASTSEPGISTRISISSRIPSSVYRWIWNSSISECSRMMASTARGYTFVPRTSFMSSTRPRIPPSYRSNVRPHEHLDPG